MTASGGLPKCASCAPGFYANVDLGSTYPLGTYGTPGATSCLACPVGTFSFYNSAGLDDCIKCPINTTGVRVGMDECDPCPAGYHTCSFGSTKCTQIPCTTPPAPPPHYPVLPRPSRAPAYGSYGTYWPTWRNIAYTKDKPHAATGLSKWNESNVEINGIGINDTLGINDRLFLNLVRTFWGQLNHRLVIAETCVWFERLAATVLVDVENVEEFIVSLISRMNGLPKHGSSQLLDSDNIYKDCSRLTVKWSGVWILHATWYYPTYLLYSRLCGFTHLSSLLLPYPLHTFTLLPYIFYPECLQSASG